MKSLSDQFDQHLAPLFLGLLVAVCTFPGVSLVYNLGIDPPLMWISDHFFSGAQGLCKKVIFPHGPLAFLVYPLEGNIGLALSVEALLKIILTVNLLRLLDEKSTYRWLLTFFMAVFFISLSNLIFLFFFSIILSYCNYYTSEKKRYKYTAFVLTAVAFYIKSYAGIISCIITGSFLLYYVTTTKKWKAFLLDVLTLCLGLFALWLYLHGSFGGFFRYCYGIFNLAGDNSSAAAYYPENNWWQLTPFLIFVFGYPFLYRSKKSLFFAALTCLSLFAAWKHAMAREDIYHVRGMFSYTVILLLIFYLFNAKRQLSFLFLSVGALSLFYLNMQHAYYYNKRHYALFEGIPNFVTWIQNSDKIKEASRLENKKRLVSNQLPAGILEKIGNATVDVYPWDYSIIPANGLNFKPRPILQSYAAYTSWLDEQDALHFASDEAPEYFIWDLDKITWDWNGGKLNSLDQRYLLNDEPQTMLALLEHYELIEKTDKFLIYKKRASALTSTSEIISSTEAEWGAWIPLPEVNKQLLRAKLTFGKPIQQRLKSFLYKDEQFYMFLRLQNGLVHKYRIVPKNAADGLWLNPYIWDPSQDDKEAEIEAIAFGNSNQNITAEKIKVDWEGVDFDKSAVPQTFFGQLKTSSEDVIYAQAFQSYETKIDSPWNYIDPAKITNEQAHTGEQSAKVLAKGYSGSFSIPLDSFLGKDLSIDVSCWLRLNEKASPKDVNLVITINDGTSDILWKGESLEKHVLDYQQWNLLNYSLRYNNQQPGTMLKIYVWNKNETPIYLDDFQINVQNRAMASVGRN